MAGDLVPEDGREGAISSQGRYGTCGNVGATPPSLSVVEQQRCNAPVDEGQYGNR